jgi:hypothetical protein
MALALVILFMLLVVMMAAAVADRQSRHRHPLKPVSFASAQRWFFRPRQHVGETDMVVARTIGPRVTQPVLYQDAGTGLAIAAIITAVSATDGTVSLVTFPPGAASATQTGVRYDYTGATGTWHYHETDVV